MDVKNLMSRNLREKPETMRLSRKMGNIDFSKLRHMGLNENVFGMSPKAVCALQEAAAPSNYYMFFDFSPKALKPTLAAEFGVDVSNIATGAGSSALIQAIGTAFLNRDDEMITCMPTFAAFIDAAQMSGAKPVILPLKEDMTFDLDAILAAITDKTKLIVICNPNNPTGTYVGEQALREFIKKVPDNIIVLFDEAYIEFAEAPDCVSMTEVMKENPDKPIIIMKTFSKFYAMAGARLGYALAQPEIIEAITKCGVGFDVSKASSAAAAEAIRDKEHGKYVLEEVSKWRKYLTDEMRAMGCKVYDSQTNFIYFDAGIEPKQLMAEMMNRGIMISASELSRVSVGVPEDNKLFIKYLKEIKEAAS